MKIVTWNCNGALRKKYQVLTEFDADLLIIQECEDPDRSTPEYKKWADNFLWIGENKNKGIGIFSRKAISIKALNWNPEGLQSFLPCIVNDSFILVAVWTKQANSPTFKYIGQLWKYLQLHKEKFVGNDVLLCGDFNSNSIWDVWDRWWNHADVVNELEGHNIKSIYHTLLEEDQGKETQPTFFLHRRKEKPYHIDYAFVSKHLINHEDSFFIGEPENWLEYSDHMPIVFGVNVS
ncbi:MAG: endonuclease/exonuclease/phosphatase family protein [Methylobacter sp.]|uniref:endonuclease/exonuclease/phosphatase family protein n=1 Tax=Methylobacter sp. TaxID=2051955 RepID=UPI00272F9E25|nr:endonuclease/exonuclease/phosphatase family protein [Methylobacter sp.]MDP1666490.1 endonuclease/exonuclease/phosphatase family protein [Methylobacter sp.]MDP1970038.1 endonuclease/exonuclease/phosphatase family protein [Methylobacter sp.]